jgi:hypothetical protein
VGQTAVPGVAVRIYKEENMGMTHAQVARMVDLTPDNLAQLVLHLAAQGSQPEIHDVGGGTMMVGCTLTDERYVAVGDNGDGLLNWFLFSIRSEVLEGSADTIAGDWCCSPSRVAEVVRELNDGVPVHRLVKETSTPKTN